MKPFNCFIKAFKSVAVYQPKQKQVKKYPEPQITDYFITEQSLQQGFESVFGFQCNIVATLIYLKMSENQDQCKLSFIAFYNFFSPFLVSPPSDLERPSRSETRTNLQSFECQFAIKPEHPDFVLSFKEAGRQDTAQI